MKEINLRDYYPFYTSDVIVEVPDEVALLLREYTLLEEAYRIRTYRYQAFYSLEACKEKVKPQMGLAARKFGRRCGERSAAQISHHKVPA